MWAWIAAFAAASLAAAGAEESRSGSLVAFVAIASGAAGCVVAGLWADRWGKARIARLALITSGACSAAAGLLYAMPLEALLVLAVIWGFSVVADSAQFSALVSEYSARTHVGTALTLQTCAGFLLTMVSMRLLPLVAASYGWRWAFLLLVPGPILGALAMSRLRQSAASTCAREHVARRSRTSRTCAVRASHVRERIAPRARARAASISPAPTESPAWRSSCNWRSKAAPPTVPPPSAGRGLRANSAHRQ